MVSYCQAMDELFRALSDPTRRALLDALNVEDGQSLSSLESKFCMSRFGVAKHLKLLEDAGIVVVRKVGREKLHFLNAAPVREMYARWMQKYIVEQAGDRLGLRDYTEGKMMSVVYESYIRTSPQALWQALTDPEMRRKYQFGLNVVSDYRPGSDYTASGQGRLVFSGTIVEADPPWRLVTTYSAHWSAEVETYGPSRVVIDIEKIEDTCRLVLTHDDLPRGASPQLYGGWPMVLSGLKTLLETGDILTTPGSLRWLDADDTP